MPRLRLASRFLDFSENDGGILSSFTHVRAKDNDGESYMTLWQGIEIEVAPCG